MKDLYVGDINQKTSNIKELITELLHTRSTCGEPTHHAHKIDVLNRAATFVTDVTSVLAELQSILKKKKKE